MANFNYSGIFSAANLAESFNTAITRDAAHGGIATVFVAALQQQFGFVLPATPRTAIGTINKWVATEKAPKRADWAHGTPAAIAVAQALHALGVALHESGKIKNLHPLAPLGAWCCPVAIEAAKAAKELAKAAKELAKTEETTRLALLVANAESEAEAEAESSADTVALVAPSADTVALVAPSADTVAPTADTEALTASIITSIKSGILSHAQLESILFALISVSEAEADNAPF